MPSFPPQRLFLFLLRSSLDSSDALESEKPEDDEDLPFNAAFILFMTSILGFFLTGSSIICEGLVITGGGPMPEITINYLLGLIQEHFMHQKAKSNG